MLGVEIHVNVEFVRVREPPEDQENRSTVWFSFSALRADIPMARRGYLCKLFLLGAAWHTATDKYFTFFDHFCGFGLIFQLPTRVGMMVELLPCP